MRFAQFTTATLLAGAGMAMAQANFSPSVTTGLVGIAAGQTARLNATRAELGAPFLTASRCAGAVVIRDSTGQTLKSQMFTDLAPGQSVSLTLNRDTEIPSPGQRTEIRGVISPGTDAQSPALCSLAVSLELYDNDTGRTTVVLEKTTPAFGEGVPGGRLAVAR